MDEITHGRFIYEEKINDELFKKINCLKMEYEAIKQSIEMEEKTNNNLFMMGEILKTDYIEYALNYGLKHDFSEDDQLFGMQYSDRMDEWISKMESRNKQLQAELDKMCLKNEKLIDMLMRNGKIVIY